MRFNIFNIRSNSSIELEEEVRANTLNAVSLLFFGTLTFFLFYNVFYTHLYKVALADFLFLIPILIIFWLQKKKKYYPAKVVFFLFLHAMVLLQSMFLLVGRGVEYFHITIIILILILNKKTSWIIFLIVLNSVFIIMPQLVYRPYPIENYSFINILFFLISVVLSIRFFIIIQNRYRNKLESQNNKLIKLNLEKNDLMSIVAHDLKTPLSQIKGLVSILELEGSQLNKDQLDLIEKIKGVTENQHKQITTFLDVNALEEKIEDVKFEEFDVLGALKNVLKDVSTLSKSKGIEIKESYDTDTILLFGSETGFAKIISNLISNAIKYSRQSSLIEIGISSDTKQILLKVKDQGQGFKKEDLHKVFTKNESLSATPTGNESSSGVGLYIVKKYVEMMNGWVWLESEEGIGSTFYVKLPKHIPNSH